MADFNVAIIKDDEIGAIHFIPLRKQNINDKGDSKND